MGALVNFNVTSFSFGVKHFLFFFSFGSKAVVLKLYSNSTESFLYKGYLVRKGWLPHPFGMVWPPLTIR
jgi:hypothetical protein